MAQNICSLCSGTGVSVNYSKTVDPPIQQYGTILGDAPQQDDFKRQGSRGGNLNCVGVCIPACTAPHNPSASQQHKSTLIQVPCDPARPFPKFVCEPQPPSPSAKIWLIKSSPVPQKSFCLPIGGSYCQESPASTSCKPLLICFRGHESTAEAKPKEEKKKEEIKPIGFISRNKDVDFIAGKLIGGCTCGRKNGLSGVCPRISCQNNPGCLMNPPRCWPQFKEPEPPPPPPPDQKMICIPIELVYVDPPPQKSGTPEET